MTRVFISYSRRNARRATRLAETLRSHGISVWFDQWEVLVGHNLADQIYNGINGANYLLILLTESSLRSRWVKEELDYAKTEEIENNGTVIVPLMYQQVELPQSLRAKAYADFTRSFDGGLQQLLRLLVPPAESDSSSEVDGDKSDLGFELFGLFFACRKVHNIMFQIPAVHEGQESEVLATLRDELTLIRGLAEYHNVEQSFYGWMSDFEGLVAAPLPPADETEARRKPLYLWSEGRILFRGGLAFRLPPRARLAFEMGRDWVGVNEVDEEHWRPLSLDVSTQLEMSNRFKALCEEDDVRGDRIREALALELSQVDPEDDRIEGWLQRRLLPEALNCGFMSLWIVRLLPADDTSSSRTDWLHYAERIAECLLANFNGIAAARPYLDMCVNTWKSDQKQTAISVFGPLINNVRVIDAAIEPYLRVSSVAQAFRLGFLLVRVLFVSHESTGPSIDHIASVDELLARLDISRELSTNVREVLNSVFYDGATDELESQIAGLVSQLENEMRLTNA